MIHQLLGLAQYRYAVEKTLPHCGEPTTMSFEITIRARSSAEATAKAATIGQGLGLMLVGPL